MHYKQLLFIGFLAWAVIATSMTEAYAGHLLAPFDVAVIREKLGKNDIKDFSCQQPPAPMADLHFESMYKKDDKSRSIVDPEADSQYKAAYKPIATYEKNLASMANRYVISKPARADIAACTLDWLYTWAKAGALLGDVNKNGEYIRKWLLASVSNAWMQVRDEPSLDAEKTKTVLSWIKTVGEAAKVDFSRDADLKSRQNNHLYWAAWGVASAGMAADDRDLFDWGMEKARFGINEIQADGTLPLELDRKKRAYLYHLFAAMPLFMLAEAGYKNGADLFRENNGGLERLARICLKNIGTGADFERLTGDKQELKRAGTSSDLGWAEVYALHYPSDPLVKGVLDKFRPMKHSRMGGNITLLYAQVLTDD